MGGEIMQTLCLILVMAGAICATIAASRYPGEPAPARPHFGWLGLALFLWAQVIAQAYHILGPKGF